MNRTKRTILLLYLIVLVVICTYVPWEAGAYNAVNRFPAGYGFIFSPPSHYVADTPDPFTKNPLSGLPITGIDLRRLFVEIIGTTALFGAVYLIAEDEKISSAEREKGDV